MNNTVNYEDRIIMVSNLRLGINMHTVNKAYSILKQEGFIQLDRRRGAVIALDIDKAEALLKMKAQLRVILAKGFCKQISP